MKNHTPGSLHSKDLGLGERISETFDCTYNIMTSI